MGVTWYRLVDTWPGMVLQTQVGEPNMVEDGVGSAKEDGGWMGVTKGVGGQMGGAWQDRGRMIVAAYSRIMVGLTLVVYVEAF